MRSTIALLVAACALACVVGVQGQAPIPYRLDGYELNAPLGFGPIAMDVFVDLLCPDCAEAWPNVLAIMNHYENNISVAIHTFPLPYHTNGFMVAQAAHVVMNYQAAQADAQGTSPQPQWIKFVTWMFNNQAPYWNPATANQGSTATLAQLQAAVVKAGFIPAADFAAAFADGPINEETRVSWKYACSRGVLGTPTFLVNGVNVNGDPSWTVADWRQVLDPLLAPKPPAKKAAVVVAPKCAKRSFASRQFVQHVADCPTTKPACNYLPGKIECCTPGESCIPNVGCRC